MSTSAISIRLAEPSDAPQMLRVIHEAFGSRRAVEPPPEALRDTVDDVRAALEAGHGVCAERDGELVGCLLVSTDGDVATLRRVSVLPSAARLGVARELVLGAVSLAMDLGCRTVELLTRREFPELRRWWEGHGFAAVRDVELGQILSRELPVRLEVPTAEAMQELGRRLARGLRRGDVILASGELGAGKTTLAQGIGEGLQVTGPVISPTFVLSRVHPSAVGGPAFVHVDAYRLGDDAELADIDLDETLDESVTLIEWGEGKAEWLSDERLEITIDRDQGDDVRVVTLYPVGTRFEELCETIRSVT